MVAPSARPGRLGGAAVILGEDLLAAHELRAAQRIETVQCHGIRLPDSGQVQEDIRYGEKDINRDYAGGGERARVFRAALTLEGRAIADAAV